MFDNENGFVPDNEAKPEQENFTEKTVDEPVAEPVENTEANDGFYHYKSEEIPNDEVAEEVPQSNKEPTYSPYSERNGNQPNYGQQNQYNNQYGNGNPYATPNNYSQYNDQPQQSYYSAPQPEAPKKKSIKGFVIAAVAVFVCAAILIGVIVVTDKKGKISDTTQKTGDSTTLQIAESASLGEASKDSAAIAQLAEKFNVGILLYGKTSSFGTSATSSLVGEGSGIIMGEDSTGKYTYIITCAHVICDVKKGNYTMTVQDYQGKTYDGIMVGYDSKTDVGVIKIEKTGLTAAEFGDSSNLVIGQQVYAIGNPGGVEFFGSFTNGMISSIDRPINSESGYEMKCIQHTTPINSGNSGGALLDETGKVIGINSSKIVSTGYEGMAFSIPITEAKTIIDDIIANGYVTNRPKLGISYVAAKSYREYSMVVSLKGLPAGSLIIASISDDSALASTKAKVGDMIIAVDGKDLTDADVLLDKIENGNVGDSLELTLCRINDDYSIDKFTVNVKLVEDDGTGSETEQTTTTQNYFEQYFGGGY